MNLDNKNITTGSMRNALESLVLSGNKADLIELHFYLICLRDNTKDDNINRVCKKLIEELCDEI